MAVYITDGQHPYSVEFSPASTELVVASSQPFGLKGIGTFYHLELNDDSTSIKETSKFNWSDGLFDVSWCKHYKSIVASSSGDGSIQIWNLKSQNLSNNVHPLVLLQEHKAEVYSVEWESFQPRILSAAWDGFVKLWDPTRSCCSISTFALPSSPREIYCARFSSKIPNIFAQVSTNGYFHLWNLVSFSGKPFASVKAHEGAEVLTCDWSNFEDNFLATGGSDGLIKGWDIRYLKEWLFELDGCEYAIRRLKFSPFARNIIVSANYDFTTRIWNFEKQSEAVEVLEHHNEFVCGVDWVPNSKNKIVDCGWDSLVKLSSLTNLDNV